MEDQRDRLITPEPENSPADHRWDDDDADDIASFYAAQEMSFASLRARYEARPRRKLDAWDLPAFRGPAE